MRREGVIYCLFLVPQPYPTNRIVKYRRWINQLLSDFIVEWYGWAGREAVINNCNSNSGFFHNWLVIFWFRGGIMSKCGAYWVIKWDLISSINNSGAFSNVNSDKSRSLVFSVSCSYDRADGCVFSDIRRNFVWIQSKTPLMFRLHCAWFPFVICDQVHCHNSSFSPSSRRPAWLRTMPAIRPLQLAIPHCRRWRSPAPSTLNSPDIYLWFVGVLTGGSSLHRLNARACISKHKSCVPKWMNLIISDFFVLPRHPLGIHLRIEGWIIAWWFFDAQSAY